MVKNVSQIITIIFIVIINCYVIPAFAQDTPPKISIIIDDLGYDQAAGMRVANLPGPIVCSVLPDVEFSTALAEKCHAEHKEIILHTPMEALTPHRLGPGGLYTDMDQADFIATLNADIKAVPYIIGLNNHEGSKLTESTTDMNWLMQDIKPQGLIFIDSVTSSHSIAEKIAKQDGVPTTTRNIFLDDIPTEDAIRDQLDALLDEADEKGQAVAIGHPYPATIAVLEQELPRLAQEGYQLVPISQLVTNKPVVKEDWQLPFLQQVWQQVIAQNAGVDSLAIVRTQIANINSANLNNNQKQRIPIVATAKIKLPIDRQIIQYSVKQSTQLANAANLMRTDFCNSYPKLCHLLPTSRS